MECGSARSQVRRDWPRAGSCLSSSVRALLWLSSRTSFRACAESRLARARPCQADALQPDGARQHVAQGFQVTGQPLQDEASVIGIERRPGGELDSRGHVVARHERPQSQVVHCQLPVAGTRRTPDAVAGQRRHRDGDLFGQPNQQRAGQVRVFEPSLARVTEKGDVDGQCEPVGGASTRADEFQILIGQDVIALQRGRVRGNSQQGVADGWRDKASGCHGVSPKGCFAFRDRLEYRDD